MTDKQQNSPQTKKRDDILATAGRLFMQDGYKAVSMDAIAEAVPVSKATLYNHFADKKTLFSAVIGMRCERLAGLLAQHLKPDAKPYDVLSAIGTQFLQMIIAPDTISMHRSIIAEAKDFPELGKLFYESGPRRSHQLLADYLNGLHTAKILNVPDAALSTALFFNALKGKQHMECLLGLRQTITPKEQAVLIDYAVTMFLKAHAV
jgi:TetR/AcrR family transcriptional repressor of mexJK operon